MDVELVTRLTELIYSNLIREDRFRLLFDGLGLTLQITLYALCMGVVIGVVIAVARIMKIKILSQIAQFYVDIIRGTPIVVQLVIIYYAVLADSSLPKTMVASIAFAINCGAYVSELIRGGILAVDKGQMEAARSLGLSWFQSMRFVVIPQAVKNILPALVNEAIALLKETAIAGYIALDDLTRAGNIIRSVNFDPYTPFLIVAIIYLYCTTTLSVFAGMLERRLLFDGLGLTLQITLYALCMGVVIGVVIAVARIMKIKILSQIAQFYVDIIRGTPIVVQLVIIYYAVLADSSLPKTMVASIAFAINCGAYVSELIRGGILAVDKGQMEAARSLGLSWFQSMRFVVIPQAVKNILPALVNEAIALLKETAIAGYIALDDLTRAGNIIRSVNFDPYTPFLIVAIIYLYCTTTLSVFAGMLERRLRASD